MKLAEEMEFILAYLAFFSFRRAIVKACYHRLKSCDYESFLWKSSTWQIKHRLFLLNLLYNSNVLRKEIKYKLRELRSSSLLFLETLMVAIHGSFWCILMGFFLTLKSILCGCIILMSCVWCLISHVLGLVSHILSLLSDILCLMS